MKITTDGERLIVIAENLYDCDQRLDDLIIFCHLLGIKRYKSLGLMAC